MPEYSLLVVDDEQSARSHVLRDIAWDKLSIQTLYEASDGLEALAIIENFSPDIILLDLKMPGMDGIALLEEMNQKKMEAQVIALSGYSDFNAARKMLASGQVVEYLLKPASEDVMFEAVYKCIANIDEKTRISRLQENLSRAENTVRRAALWACLFGNEQEEENEEILSLDRYVQVAVIFSENMQAVKASCHHRIAEGNTVLEQCYQCPYPRQKALVFCGDTREALADAETICQDIALESEGRIGLGRIYRSESNLNISYQEALLACMSRSILGGQSCLPIDEVERRMALENEDIITTKQVASMLEAGDLQKVSDSMERLLKSVLSHRKELLFAGDKDKIDIGAISIYFANFVDSVLKDRKEELNIAAILASKDLEELLHIVDATFMQYYESRKPNNKGHKAAIVREVKDYIQRNYQDRITLDQVAQIVYINASYLSKIFSEVEDCGFSDYIARIRIERAKELLLERKYKIYEIAELVGYHNVKHFMRVFKKLEGMTPSEYKEEHILF